MRAVKPRTPNTGLARRARIAAAAGLVAVVLAGCGEDEPADGAVEAQEQNTVELAGAEYRVLLFRELNVLQPPDDAVWTGSAPDRGSGLYMAVLRACAVGEEPVRTTSDIHLEDAFGQEFEPRDAATADEFEYRAAQLEPGDCQPPPSSPASRTFDGAVLVFEVPFEAAAERPMILELGAPDADRDARIELDL